MKKIIQNTLLSLSAALWIGMSQAAVIDFSAAPAGPFASYSEQGVTFTASGGGGQIEGTNTPNGTTGLLEGNAPRKEIRADITGGASSVSIDLGDFGSDPDLLFLEIFDSVNVLLASTTLLIPGTDATMHTLSLSNPNIAYAVFGARAPALNGSSAFADNFTFTPGAVVPEPDSLALFGLALTGLLGVARRKQKR